MSDNRKVTVGELLRRNVYIREAQMDGKRKAVNNGSKSFA